MLSMFRRGTKVTFNSFKPLLPMMTGFRACSGATSTRSKLVETETQGNVFLININRPEVRNCVNIETGQELVKAIQEFENREDLYVAVLYGKGGCFCAGYDLKALSSSPQLSESVDFSQSPLPERQRRFMGPSIMNISKPIIAAVNGYAVAGGLELALMCDLRVMEESAIMGVFCRRFGVPLIDGGTVRLPKLIGLSRALDLILTGRPVKAKEAFEMGLANRVVPTGSAVEEAVALAQSICQFPQECMRADRRSAYNSTYQACSLDEAFDYEFTNGLNFASTESVKGAQKFVSGIGRHGKFDNKSKL